MTVLRLRRSEWHELHGCVDSLFLPAPPLWRRKPGEVMGIRGHGMLYKRMARRGLIEPSPDQRYWRITAVGLASYWAHPVNWGRSDGPANCHPGRVG